jgi:hypothetical protein
VAKHEEVAAEEKVVVKLLHLNLSARDRFASCIPQSDGNVALAVPFDARPGLSEDFVVGRFGFLVLSAPGGLVEQQGGCAGASLKECSSVHSHSKRQWAALLKLKILFILSDSGQASRVGHRVFDGLAPLGRAA